MGWRGRWSRYLATKAAVLWLEATEVKAILAAHLLCSIGMFGVIWVIQLVHYPLFDRVDREDYASFQQAHEARISFVVVPLMLGELTTAIALVMLAPVVTRIVWLSGLALVAVAWLATFAFSVPAHQSLGAGFDIEAHNRLVSTNWIRTLAWTGHAVVAIYGTFLVLAEVGATQTTIAGAGS